MKAKEGVVDYLNRALTNSLTAINQYFVHAKMAKNWGYERTADTLRDYSIDVMKDAESLTDHILYLEGLPNLQRLGTIHVGESIPEDFRLDLNLEQDAARLLIEAIQHCLNVGDYTSHSLLEKVLEQSEERIDWLETQLGLIEQLSAPTYLSQQIH